SHSITNICSLATHWCSIHYYNLHAFTSLFYMHRERHTTQCDVPLLNIVLGLHTLHINISTSKAISISLCVYYTIYLSLLTFSVGYAYHVYYVYPANLAYSGYPVHVSKRSQYPSSYYQS